MYRPLIVLALGTFAIGTAGFVTAGILSPILPSFGVGVATAGLFVTVFAIAYAVCAPVLAAATGRWPRRVLLAASLALFVVGSVATALVSAFGLALGGWVVTVVGAALFGAMVREEAEKVAAAVPPKIERVEDFGELAGRTLDYKQAHPERARLVLWEGLADSGATHDELKRSAIYKSKVEAVAAQREGLIDDAVDPAYLVFMLIALASWWDTAPQIARNKLTGADPADPEERARRRSAVEEAARRIARPRGP